MMAASTAPRSCGLLDLPNELLLQCMPQYGFNRGACRKLFNLQVVGYNSRSLRLHVGLKRTKDGAEKQARKTLQGMVESFPALRKLAVSAENGVPPDALGRLMAPHPTHGPTWLINLVDITFSSLTLADSFIPKCIADACPQIQRLKLSYVHCKHLAVPHGAQRDMQQQQQQQWQPVTLPHLTQLVLDKCTIEMEAEAVKQQLDALPSLEEFKATTDDSAGSNMFSSKVTALIWEDVYGSGQLNAANGMHPKLWELEAGGMEIDDDDLEVIMETMPNLEDLLVSQINLGGPCSKPLPHLTSISVYGGSLTWFSLQSLRDMALSCANPLAITLRSGEYTAVEILYCGHGSTVEEDLAKADSVVAGLQKAQAWVHVEDSCALFFISSDEPPHAQQVLHRTFPVFADLTCLMLEGSIHVSTALLTAVGHFSSIEELVLRDHDPHSSPFMAGAAEGGSTCSFEDDMWDGRMISLLPPKVERLVLWCSEATEARVTHLCLHAPRPIKVCVKPIGWKDPDLVKGILNAAPACKAELEIV